MGIKFLPFNSSSKPTTEGWCIVNCGTDWSPSGCDIAEWRNGKFISQTNYEDISELVTGYLSLP